MTTIQETKQPFFIFIEGADGTGKTTTSSLLTKELTDIFYKKVAKDLIMQSTSVGTMLRLTAVEENTSEELKFLAFCFGVFYGLEKLPILHQGNDFVIIDRSHGSTYAQSICASNASEANKTAMVKLFTTLNEDFKEKYKDSCMFVHLEANPEKALNRLHQERGCFDVLEQRGVQYQAKIQNGYKAFYSYQMKDVDLLPIDTDKKSPVQVVSTIIKHLQEKGKL